MPRITNSLIESKIELPSKGQIIIRDDALQGFAIRLTPGGVSYICECRVAGKFRRVTIGRHGKPWTPETARKQAWVILGSMSAGVDPVKQKEKDKAVSLTLEQAFDEYLASKIFRRNSILTFTRVIKGNLQDWLNTPVTGITRQMVEDRFKQLSSGSKRGTSGKANANLTMHVLRAVLNWASLKYEVDGEPLIAVNPVARLTQTRVWHKLPRRQGTIPDHKLAAWYKAVLNLGNPTARDYYLMLLFTGLRRNEAAQLEWRDIDLDTKTLTIRAEVNKGGHEFRLPLSTFVFDLLSRRFAEHKSEYVFPGIHGKGRYWGCYPTLRKLRQESGCNFIIHDVRRTTLTMAERLDTPHYALKKLAGHSMREDITAGYLVIDVERLREPMQKIADRFTNLMSIKRLRSSRWVAA